VVTYVGTDCAPLQRLGQLSLATFAVAKLTTSVDCRGKCRNVTSAGWQVTLCDPIRRHVSSRSGEAELLTKREPLYGVYFILLFKWYIRRDSVAEWLACWTQAQKGSRSYRSRNAVG